MEKLLKKLDYQTNTNIVIFNIPEELVLPKQDLYKGTKIYKNNTAIKTDFILVFIKTKLELENFVKKNESYLLSFQNDLVWFAYPRPSSEKYNEKNDLSREKGWDSLMNLGYKGIKTVYIDDNWTAYKFLKEEYIK